MDLLLRSPCPPRYPPPARAHAPAPRDAEGDVADRPGMEAEPVRGRARVERMTRRCPRREREADFMTHPEGQTARDIFPEDEGVPEVSQDDSPTTPAREDPGVRAGPAGGRRSQRRLRHDGTRAVRGRVADRPVGARGPRRRRRPGPRRGRRRTDRRIPRARSPAQLEQDTSTTYDTDSGDRPGPPTTSRRPPTCPWAARAPRRPPSTPSTDEQDPLAPLPRARIRVRATGCLRWICG